MTQRQTFPRSFAEIPQGSIVGIDANVLAYHFIEIDQLTAASTALLERGLRKELVLITTPQIVSDVIHRMMLYEARQLLALPANQLATHLKQHPQVVQQLTHHLDVPSLLRRFRIDIRPLTYVHLHAAKRFRRDYGLLANDSLLLGFMVTEQIQHLASNDRDFRRISDVTLWIP